jgi:hypothetical protein
VGLKWSAIEQGEIERGIARHPVESGRCAALARVVYAVAQPGDPDAGGLQVLPKSAARFVVPKHDPKPRWGSHTLVETRRHCVDALTGASGTLTGTYLSEHWEYVEHIHMVSVDVFAVDVGIEDDV